MLDIYSPVRVGALYIAIRGKYFTFYKKASNFNTNDFVQLARFLNKEQVNPEKYFEFVFGILDNKKPLTPKGLCNPLLIRDFKSMTL